MYDENKFLESLYGYSIVSSTLVFNMVLFSLLIIFTMGIATCIAFRISHKIFRPLRKLNFKMRNIINNELSKDLGEEEESSLEISNLYEVFNSHIKTKKFEDNGFIKKLEEVK